MWVQSFLTQDGVANSKPNPINPISHDYTVIRLRALEQNYEYINWKGVSHLIRFGSFYRTVNPRCVIPSTTQVPALFFPFLSFSKPCPLLDSLAQIPNVDCLIIIVNCSRNW